MSWTRWTALVIGLLVILVAVMFTLQNSARVSDLSLNLGFAAWHLQAPAPVPWLLWGALGGWGFIGRLKDGRRLRELETRAARADVGGRGGGGDGWT
jgi:uncharacterized integral membrane protein